MCVFPLLKSIFQLSIFSMTTFHFFFEFYFLHFCISAFLHFLFSIPFSGRVVILDGSRLIVEWRQVARSLPVVHLETNIHVESYGRDNVISEESEIYIYKIFKK